MESELCVRTVFSEWTTADNVNFSVYGYFISELHVLLIHCIEHSGTFRKVTRCYGTAYLGETRCDEYGGAVRLAVKEADLFIEKVRAANGWPY